MDVGTVFESTTTILVFVIAPLIGILILGREAVNSVVGARSRTRFAEGLVAIASATNDKDMLGIYSSIQLYLRNNSEDLKTVWMKAGSRFLFDLADTGFGEFTRPDLENRAAMRREALVRSLGIVEAMRYGFESEMFEEMSALYALLYCKSNSITRDIKPNLEAAKVLRKCSQMMPYQLPSASAEVTRGLHRVARACNDEEVGMALLTLNWAKIVLQGREDSDRKSQSWGVKRVPLSERFARVAEYLQVGDYASTMREISASFA